jgi:callose synthase
MFSYLKTVHPDEWDNFVERLGIRKEVDAAGGDIPESVWSNPEQATEVQLWASLRGQTLARTICGVMQFEKALLMFAKQESQYNQTVPSAACSNLSGGDSGSGDIGTFDADATTSPRPLWKADPLWMRRAHLKYAYVISCQVYGKWDDKNELKIGVDTLMKRFPHLRIAYVQEENGKFFSYLIRWDEERNRIVKCYRIEQACSKGGNANWGPAWLVGEGKPENQNHAIVFTRGEYLQTLDMNQDGYFEEALKMRNLLQEFLEEGNEDVRIIGFPEHQFSDALSAVAEFAALTEFTFATLIQRTLGSPFDVRMHYGHPDVFDRIFHVTRGGISKPTKTLCVSEDIFGAFNSVLKGGRVIHREYIKQGKGKDLGFDACALFEQKISSGNAEQALSRDFSRLCEQMGITRLLSFFHSSNGFYWSNLFVIWGTSYFLYSQILISVVIPDEHDGALMTVTESVAFAFQLGLLLTIPLVAELILQKGPMAAFMTMIRVLYTMGPLFFMFHIRTKAYYYERTLGKTVANASPHPAHLTRVGSRH